MTLGTSLLVKPAMLLPQLIIKDGGKVAIVNLQSTPLDKVALIDKYGIRIWAKVDDVIERLFKVMQLVPPKKF